MKAIRITAENKKLLEHRFSLNPGSLDLESGKFMIVLRPDRMYGGLLTRAQLREKYDILSIISDSGTFGVVPKSVRANV